VTRLLLAVALLAVPAVAGAGVLPLLPRVVLPPDALPQPGDPPAGETEDAAAIAERIARTTKAVGDRLAERDTGPETLKGQEQVRRDIDALLKSLENPPPMGGGGEGGSPPPPAGGGQGGSLPPPSGGGGQGGPMKPTGGQGQQQPMGGAGQGGQPQGGGQPMGGGQGRPRRGGRGQQQPTGGADRQPGTPQPQGGRPMPGEQPAGGQAGREPMGQGKAGGEGKPAGGMTPGTGGGKSTPALPLAEAIAKDFWGHLPEQPRQRMMQFFREQYMSRYKDLLPQYYSSLAEKEKKNKR
jgi:hypothetical protein